MNINILDYIKEINSKFYNIDISFVNLVSNNDICILHQKLIDFKVISKQNCSAKMKEYKFKKKVDFLLSENREAQK